MLKLYDMQAMAWYDAEKREGEIPWAELPESRRNTIRDRVKRVLSGEVSRSACSIGDLVVLEGKFRFASRMEPPDDGTAELPRQPGSIYERRWWHFYDSMEFGQETPVCASTRLCSNNHIGYYDLSNFQVAGQLPAEHLWTNRYLYVTVAGFDESDETLLRRVLESGIMTFILGDMPVGTHRLYDLFTAPRIADFTIPQRQYVSPQIDFHGQDFRKLDDKMKTRDRERRSARIVLHMEGWHIRPVY